MKKFEIKGRELSNLISDLQKLGFKPGPLPPELDAELDEEEEFFLPHDLKSWDRV